MKRDAVLSMAIGALATYLPFWEWGAAGVQAVGAMAIAVVVFIVLIYTKEDTTNEKKSN